MRFHYIPKILIHCTMLKWATNVLTVSRPLSSNTKKKHVGLHAL